MRTNFYKPVAIISTLGLLLSLACHTTVVARVSAGQPHMETARQYIESAKAELQAAEANKGGHRETAIGLCDQTVQEINAGIEYAHAHP